MVRSGKPDWPWLREAMSAPIVSMDTYLEMPEELSRTIEVVDGMIVHCESPSGNHQGVERLRLTSGRHYALEQITFRGQDHVAVQTIDPLELALSWEQLDEWL